ncbi:MAG TPA: sodium:proton antiporter [Pyrinomonadaceae bacterium]|nr:sodium:proton antiporter [Pyrinomonadaceae bacterium]
MDFHGWMAVVGFLLLFMALSPAYLRNLPVSTSAIYLVFGLIVSPVGFGLIHLDLIESASWFEYLTEVAVITSLFIGGLKLRLPLKNPAWRAAFVLAGPVMLGSIIGVALFVHLVFGLSVGVSLLLGAVLAPTDPVLAASVSVNDAGDHDRMRYGLSGEAGFNDGMAFPFVVFALLWEQNNGLGDWVGWWAAHRLLWAVPVGLALGYFLGKGVGRLAIWLRSRHQDNSAPNDFLALALIALSYVGAEYIGAWGFLSVFAAGFGLRRAEIKIVDENPLPEAEEAGEENSETDDPSIPYPPAEESIGKALDEEELEKPAVAAGVVIAEIISFGATADRLLEIMLVVLVGICLAFHWDWRALPLALAFFCIIRPVVAYLLLWKTPTTKFQRGLMAWFGIRGIGSLYYLSYALNHGLSNQVTDAVNLTVSVVALSIVIHGISSQPVLARYEEYIKRKAKKSDDSLAEQNI